MRKRICNLLAGIIFFASVQAQLPDLAVSKIAPALLKNANHVVRFEELTFEILNAGAAIEKTTYAITILNESGDDHAGLMEQYDKIHSITSIEGSLYDAAGKLIRKIKPKEVQDLSGVSNSNLMDDYRKKYHHFYHRVYPYTVVYEVTKSQHGTLFFPVWMPQWFDKVSIETSRLKVIYPAGYQVRHKTFNYSGDPVAETVKNKSSLTWEVKNKPAIQAEYASPDRNQITTAVYLGPSAFKIQGYEGNMATWQDFGKFVFSLTQGRDILPDAVKQKVQLLVKDLKTDREKIMTLYDYLQKNTRYISIQLGIGGWQPFDAKYVSANGYGDCKALTNYMYSLLKEAGIHSYYSLVKAGNTSEVIADFPSQQFNHVILSVPLQQDTMWLECTSQSLPAGYLSNFTSNRYALMVDANGGKLVKTPRYGLDENLQVRRIKSVLKEDGTLTVGLLSEYGGIQQDGLHSLIHNVSKDKVKEILRDQLNFGTYEVDRFEYNEQKSTSPLISELLELTVKNYATITGKRLFLTPNVMTRTSRKLNTDEERIFDVNLDFEYRDLDSVEIELPQGYVFESVPKAVTIESKFGKYVNRVEFKDNKLFYYRIMEEYGGRYPAKDYTELAKFYSEVYQADRSRVVLVKTENVPPKAF